MKSSSYFASERLRLKLSLTVRSRSYALTTVENLSMTNSNNTSRTPESFVSSLWSTYLSKMDLARFKIELF